MKITINLSPLCKVEKDNDYSYTFDIRNNLGKAFIEDASNESLELSDFDLTYFLAKLINENKYFDFDGFVECLDEPSRDQLYKAISEYYEDDEE